MKYVKTFALLFVLMVAWIAVIEYLKSRFSNNYALDIVGSVGGFIIGTLCADYYLTNKK